MKNLLRKPCKIGELEFSVVIDNKTAQTILQQHPNYWKFLNKASQFKGNNIEKLSPEEMANLMVIESEYEELCDEITRTALPLMLENAGEKGGYKTSKEYADKIIEYCVENGVYGQFEAQNGKLHDGFSQAMVEFVNQAFTKGKVVEKAKISDFAF